MYVRTNDGAARYALYTFDPKKPERAGWKRIIAEKQDVLSDVAPMGAVDLVATYLSDASSKVRVFSKSGEAKGDVALPTVGSTAGAAGRWDGDEAFYDFSSFAVAPTIYRLDLKSAKSEKWDAVEAPIDPSAFDVERIRATSKDGTKVPIFLIHKKGIKRDGKTPTLLTGYGSFNISIVPTFSASMYLLLERGGILAVANLRGGGEFGETWHKAGMLGNKQNVFDDAIAAASELISSGYTDSTHLALFGQSNGGLLVGALVTQRPDLFRAAVCGVPLLDMLRYQRFRIAKLWIAEYGSSEDPKQFEWLYKYSPYHQVKPGTPLPGGAPHHHRKQFARRPAARAQDGGGHADGHHFRTPHPLARGDQSRPRCRQTRQQGHRRDDGHLRVSLRRARYFAALARVARLHGPGRNNASRDINRQNAKAAKRASWFLSVRMGRLMPRGRAGMSKWKSKAPHDHSASGGGENFTVPAQYFLFSTLAFWRFTLSSASTTPEAMLSSCSVSISM